ncbi:unnamed protein product, partial [Symbiodinium pilosum]
GSVLKQRLALTVIESKPARSLAGRAWRPSELLVVLELLGVVLEHPELGGGLRLHVLGRGVHGLVGPRVVGLRGVGHVVVPLAAPAGHLAREVLLQRLDGSVHHGRGVPVLGPLLAVHHPLGQVRRPGLRQRPNRGRMAEEAALDLLRRLAGDFNVRDARKLYQIAKREFPDQPAVTVNRARDALRGDVARQVLAPKPRSLGKSAAEGPNDRLQADLIDFFQNTRSAKKYGLVVTDVFTREAVTRALPNKNAETVARAAAEAIPDLVQDEGNYVVTTDEGNEFRTLEANLPQGAVHRQKRPEDRNATAVVDRTIQTLKKDLAGEVARRGGKWDDHVADATEAYNARPHEAVHAAPEDVETQPATQFRVLQDNAEKFQHNKQLMEGRQARLQQAGAFRAPTNANRSFQPSYGPAKDLAGFDSITVRATDGSETLLKHALPVPRGSAEPKAALTRRPPPAPVRQLRDFNAGPAVRLAPADRPLRRLE